MRKILIEQKIYCPVHWPLSNLHNMEERTLSMIDCELSLVCDQRYTEKDMERIIEAINLFWKQDLQ